MYVCFLSFSFSSRKGHLHWDWKNGRYPDIASVDGHQAWLAHTEAE